MTIWSAQVSPNNHLDAELKFFINGNTTVWQNVCSWNLHWIFAHLSNRRFWICWDCSMINLLVHGWCQFSEFTENIFSIAVMNKACWVRQNWHISPVQQQLSHVMKMSSKWDVPPMAFTTAFVVWFWSNHIPINLWVRTHDDPVSFHWILAQKKWHSQMHKNSICIEVMQKTNKKHLFDRLCKETPEDEEGWLLMTMKKEPQKDNNVETGAADTICQGSFPSKTALGRLRIQCGFTPDFWGIQGGSHVNCFCPNCQRCCNDDWFVVNVDPNAKGQKLFWSSTYSWMLIED